MEQDTSPNEEQPRPACPVCGSELLEIRAKLVCSQCHTQFVKRVVKEGEVNMDDQSHNRLEAGDPRIYFAAERTLLAWVRTGLAMMGFGFVVARFGLFLHELATVRNAPSPKSYGFSLWIGTVLVLLGVAVQLIAAYQQWKNIVRLHRGEELEFRTISLGIVVAVALGITGLLMAIFLVVTGHWTN